MKMEGINSSCELKRFVIVIEVILVLGSEKDSGEDHFVDVKIVQAEVRHPHIIAVDIDYRDY